RTKQGYGTVPHPCESSGLGQVLVGKVPVDHVLQEGGQEIRTTVLEVQIIGVLPDIADQQGSGALGQRSLRIWRLDDLQLAAFRHQPYPAATELAHAASHEFLLEGVVAAEIGIDAGCNVTAGSAAAIGA